MSYWALLLLVAITLALVVLPVTPALHELYKQHDARPLPTSGHDGRITNFAESFQSRIEPLRRELDACRARKEIRRTRLDTMQVLLVGHNGFDFDAEQLRDIDAVMCSHASFIPSGRVVAADVCSLEDLNVGEGAALRAGVASGDIVLERNSAVLRWLHGHRNIYVGSGSSAANRLSADQAIFLDSGCRFQHMRASTIFTLEQDPYDDGLLPCHSAGTSVRVSRQKASAPAVEADAPEEKLLSADCPRMRIQGDFVLPAGQSLRANVIATGEFRVERGASFFGTAKSYRNTVIEEGASVYGSIACGGTAYLGPNSFLSGPLMVEDDVHLARGSCVGTPDSPTTITACGASLTAGCQIHGTIWARLEGRVEG